MFRKPIFSNLGAMKQYIILYWKPVNVGVQWLRERVKIVIENHNVTLPVSDKIWQSQRPKPTFIDTRHIIMKPPDCTLFCWQLGSLASCNLHHARTHQNEITGRVTHRTTLNSTEYMVFIGIPWVSIFHGTIKKILKWRAYAFDRSFIEYEWCSRFFVTANISEEAPLEYFVWISEMWSHNYLYAALLEKST